MDKENVINIHIHIYLYTYTHACNDSSIKDKEILPFATTWINMQGVILMDISQKERHIMDVITYMKNIFLKRISQKQNILLSGLWWGRDAEIKDKIDKFLYFPGGAVVKNSSANAGGTGSTAGLGRSPGLGNGNPLQYSWPGKFHEQRSWQDRVHGVVKSQTQLSMHTYKLLVMRERCFEDISTSFY